MIHSFHIENIAVIRRADIELDQGFSVLTGETGAGKSMIIDSINLLLGNKVPREIIRTGAERATVSAVFESLSEDVTVRLAEMGFSSEDGTWMLQKTLSLDGRSRALLNGQAITQSVQREIARLLISIHGQNDNQKLLQKGTHLSLVDAYARPHDLEEYRETYAELRRVQKEIASISQSEAEKLRLREMLSYQIADIDALKLVDGEEERLTRERDRLANAEQINRLASGVYRALRGSEKGSAMELVSRSERALEALSSMIEGAETLAERLSAVYSELEDIAELSMAFCDDDREDPTARIDRIEGRLDAISKLKRKYGGSIAEILTFRNTAAVRLVGLENADEHLAKLQKQEQALLIKAKALAANLTKERKKAAEEIEAAVLQTLAFLDMPKIKFKVGFSPCDLCEGGADDVEFLVATNPGEPLLPLIKIASGGELSRMMLALRTVLGDREGVGTVIFDEVDTGVSGKTARKVGLKLLEVSRTVQVICVTHSAQVSSLADAHYLITKTEKEGRAETAITLLDTSDRIEELARILGGISVTDAQRAAAREMLEEYR